MPQLTQRSLHGSFSLNRFDYGNAGPRVYIQAGVHANEYPALAAANALKGELDRLEAAGRLLGQVSLVPVANPVGMEQWLQGQHLGRYHADSGTNFNRGYTDLRQPLIQAVAGKLTQDVDENDTLVRKTLATLSSQVVSDSSESLHKATLLQWSATADFVLDLHCDEEAEAHLYASRRTHEALLPLAQALKIPYVLVEDDSGGGSFDEAISGCWAAVAAHYPNHPLGDGCCGCTVEFRGERDVSAAQAAQDAQGIVAFLQKIGVVEGPPPAVDFQPKVTELTAVDLLNAPETGLIYWEKRVGDRVSAGDVLAHIQPLNGEAVPVAARNSGEIMTTVSRRYVRAGSQMAKVVGDTPLAWRSGYLLGD